MGQEYYSVRMRASDLRGRHISGAECIVEKADIDKAVLAYRRRAMEHPRGMSDEVTLTVEKLRRSPRHIAPLRVTTAECESPMAAEALIIDRLTRLGVSGGAIRKGLAIVRAKNVMRGAAILDASTGQRLDSTKERGVRATLLGLAPESAAKVRRSLSRRGLNKLPVIEALTLASKVSSAPGVVAELCASDDPAYTTGYIASRSEGYLRVENIKDPGSMSGGRVFFLKPGADPEATIKYLRQTPVLVG